MNAIVKYKIDNAFTRGNEIASTYQRPTFLTSSNFGWVLGLLLREQQHFFYRGESPGEAKMGVNVAVGAEREQYLR